MGEHCHYLMMLLPEPMLAQQAVSSLSLL